MQAALCSTDKRPLVIPHAGHNGQMAVRLRQHVEALAAFVGEVGAGG